MRNTEEILHQAALTLSFSRPVAVMMLGVLGQVPDSATPRAVVARLLIALPPGSYLALSDCTSTSSALDQAITAYNQIAASSYHLRSPGQIACFLDGLTLLPPGVVTLSLWRPEVADISGGPRAADTIFGVGRKH